MEKSWNLFLNFCGNPVMMFYILQLLQPHGGVPHQEGGQNLANLSKYVYIFEMSRSFLGLIWARLLAPSQFKNMQKLFKMVYIIPNFLVQHFGEKFMKSGTKKLKLQMHENLHQNVNENIQIFMSFYEVQLKQLISYMLFNPFKIRVQFF